MWDLTSGVMPAPVSWTSADGAMVHGILWLPLEANGFPPPLLADAEFVNKAAAKEGNHG